MKRRLYNLILRFLMFPSPQINLTPKEKKQLELLFEHLTKANHPKLEYNLPIPKYKFLSYIVENRQVILHGSNHPSIHTFEPRDQTLFNGKPVNAVFATKDPIWSIFYAVFRKESVYSNFRNGCISADYTYKYHFYSLTKETFQNKPWTSGTVYILPQETFQHVGSGDIIFDEWISKEPVTPIAKIEVEPEDFYFLSKVASHHANERLLKTWLLYKIRILTQRKNKNAVKNN
ncbi:MAG: hypothetical protein ACO1OT_09215 [Heyndrickxia sp.]